ncbi:MAG TPA: D-alanyl-D-alanine carboxypeptidase/D-alanyl-D-alanine-endopeptidase [Polyangia bacterium]|nr:D-alanyl-D-alanine carboxypeptidase/D-alanyl-D-alanine-endopeptidase [Polyangia bacterium]
MRPQPPLRVLVCLGLLATVTGPSARAKPAEPEPTAAPAPNPQPAPASEAEPATTGKGGPRPLMGLAPRPAGSPELPKPPRDPAERRAWLDAQLDAVFRTPPLARAKVSAIVVAADSGRTLYAHDDKATLNAASNVKIVTSAAALSLLGPEYRWRTTLAVNGPPGGPPLPAGGEVSGDLYLRGSGDPTLSTEDLAEMVNELAALGLRKVRGALVIDDTLFEGGYVPPAYDQKNDSTASRAPSSAASLDGNVVGVTVIPGAAAGAPARVVVEPASPYFVVAGRVVTAAGGPAAPSVDTKEEGQKTRINVAGRIKLGADPRTIYRRVAQPSLFLGQTLRQLLERRGISIGNVRVGGSPGQGLRVLAAHDSAPLAVVVQDLNKRSNNFAAEQLLRTVGAEIGGHPGSWDKGLKAVARYLAGIGIKADSYEMKNGSGLYDSNRFSAAQIATILRAAAHDFRISAEFLASLAVAGTDGTIAHRMGATLAERYVRAKTGTLANVSCLSGFAGSPGRLPLVFSILVNDVGNPNDARHAQDRAAEILVAYLEGDGPPK